LDENVHDLVFAKHQAEQVVQAAVDERRRIAQEKKMQSLQNALAKFTACPNGLTVPEMKALVLAATTSTDSPVKSKKAELQVQLYREPKYGKVQALTNDFRITSTSTSTSNTITANESMAGDAAQGLLALVANDFTTSTPAPATAVASTPV
jgi:hypothetical protein